MNQSNFLKLKNKERLETLKVSLGILLDLAKVLFAAGAIIIFSYCFSESLLPRDIRLGDTFPFLYVAFSFAFILVFGVFVSTYSSIPILQFMLWIIKRLIAKNVKITIHPIIDGKETFLLSSITLTIIFSIPFQFETSRDINFWYTVSFFIFLGIFVLVLFFIKSNTEKYLTTKQKFGALFVVSVLGLMTCKPNLLNMTMAHIGMRSKVSDYILIDKKNYELTEALAKALNLPFKACKVGDTGKWITSDLQIVWNGIGNKTFVRIIPKFAPEKISGSNSLYSLDKAGIEIFRSAGVSNLCK